MSHCGAYSVARLQALDSYCQLTSPQRVLAVCLLTPMPSLVFVLLLEWCIPLQSTKLGWDASNGIWIRCAVTNTMLTFNFIVQSHQMLPDLTIPRWRIACVAMCTGVSFAGASMLIAWLWAFPIPFAFVVTSTPFACLAIFFFTVVIGPEPFTRVQELRRKLYQLTRMMCVQFTLIVIYPMYSALFLWFSRQQITQTVFLVTLPILKLIMKNLMANTFRGTDLEDSLPEITVFSVEIFNALYISACLQMVSTARLSTLIIIFLDVLQSVVSARGILKRSVISRKLDALSSSDRLRSRKRSLHASVEESCQQLRFIRGTLELNVSPLLSIPDARKWYHKWLRVPLSCSIVPAPSPNPPSRGLSTREERAQIVSQTLKMLFNCEYLVLVEYIECMIPILYTIYTTTMFYLPNAAFYPHIASLTTTTLRSAMNNLGAYILLEVLTLLGLCLLLHWKLRVSALYQLAFVLETHMEMIQAKLFVWVTYSLTYGLEHSGMDFTPITEWLDQLVK